MRVGLLGGDEVDSGRALMNGISAFIKKIPESSSLCHVRTQQEDIYESMNQGAALTRYQICWYLELGLSSLQNHEKYMFVVQAPQRMVIAA